MFHTCDTGIWPTYMWNRYMAYLHVIQVYGLLACDTGIWPTYMWYRYMAYLHVKSYMCNTSISYTCITYVGIQVNTCVPDTVVILMSYTYNTHCVVEWTEGARGWIKVRNKNNCCTSKLWSITQIMHQPNKRVTIQGWGGGEIVWNIWPVMWKTFTPFDHERNSPHWKNPDPTFWHIKCPIFGEVRKIFKIEMWKYFNLPHGLKRPSLPICIYKSFPGTFYFTFMQF